MSSLNCPWCPAQSYPKIEPIELWVGGFKLYVPMKTFRCTLGHLFYVEKEAIDGRTASGRSEQDEQSVSRCC